MTVRIRPRLDAKLVGPRVAGAPLSLEATVEPAAAGPIRVQVIRGGAVGFDKRFAGGGAAVQLDTRKAGDLTVRVFTEPRAGLRPAAPRAARDALLAPNLSLGTTSPTVSDLARQLATLHYAVPSFSPTFGNDFQETRLGVPEGAGARAHRRGRRGLLDAARQPADPAGAIPDRRTTSRSTRPARCSISSATARSR